MAWHNNPRIVTNGLVLCLDANDIKSYPGSGTTWYDRSEYSNDMTLQNSPVYTNDYNGGFILTGSSPNYINASFNSINFDGTFSIELWIRFDAGDSIAGGGHIVGSSNRNDGLIRAANGNNTHLTIDGSNNLKIFTFDGGGTYTDYDTGFNISLGEVCQVGMVHISGSQKAGIKNGLVSSAQSYWSTQNPVYLLIGGEHNEGSYFTQMDYPNITIFSVKCYSKALSSDEVLQNYNAHKSRFGL